MLCFRRNVNEPFSFFIKYLYDSLCISFIFHLYHPHSQCVTSISFIYVSVYEALELLLYVFNSKLEIEFHFVLFSVHNFNPKVFTLLSSHGKNGMNGIQLAVTLQ